MAFDQRGDVRVPRAREQVPFPVSRDRSVLDLSWPLPDRDGVDDPSPALPVARSVLPTAHRALAAQVGDQLLLEPAARLDEQAAVDRLVR